MNAEILSNLEHRKLFFVALLLFSPLAPSESGLLQLNPAPSLRLLPFSLLVDGSFLLQNTEKFPWYCWT